MQAAGRSQRREFLRASLRRPEILRKTLVAVPGSVGYVISEDDIMKTTIRSSISAIVAGLFLPAGVFALDFSGGTGNSLAESVREMKSRRADAGDVNVSTISQFNGEDGFWEELGRNTFDGACKDAEIKLNQKGWIGENVGVSSKFLRRMSKFQDGRLALIDEVGMDVSLGLGHELVDIPELGALVVSFSGTVEGKSMVIRPLESDRYCRELSSLVNLLQVKTAVPAKASRLSAMKTGEIWKLPLVLRMGFQTSIGGAAGALSLAMTSGRAKESRPSVTLFRMDARTLRLRLRLENLTVESSGAALAPIEIPFSDIGLAGAENILARRVDRIWAREINKYLALKISYDRSQFTGKKLLLEFLLDPRDPVQMQNLEMFLAGDYGILKRFMEMGLRFGTFSENAHAQAGLDDIGAVSAQAGRALGVAPSFSGSNLSHGNSSAYGFQIPVLHSHETRRDSAYNRYQTTGKAGEVFHVHQQGRSSAGKSMNVPFAGTFSKYNSERRVYVVNKESADGSVSAPVMMYSHNEGFVRQGDAAARGMVEKANGLLRYVGTGGAQGGRPGLLPAGEIFPAAPAASEEDFYSPSKVYNTAMLNLRVLISERGVGSVIMAPARQILNAYLNMMRETEAAVIDKVWDLLEVDDSGVVRYESKAIHKRLRRDWLQECEGGTNPLEIVGTLARAATALIKDISSVRETSDWRERSVRLSEAASGGSRSGLSHQDFMKVILQLVRPEDVTAEVYLHTDKRVKGEEDVTRTYTYGGSSVGLSGSFSEVTQYQNRFGEPTELTD